MVMLPFVSHGNNDLISRIDLKARNHPSPILKAIRNIGNHQIFLSYYFILNIIILYAYNCQNFMQTLRIIVWKLYNI